MKNHEMATKTSDANDANGSRVTRSIPSRRYSSCETNRSEEMTTPPAVVPRGSRPQDKAPVRLPRPKGKGRTKKDSEKHYKVEEAVVTGLKVTVKASLIHVSKPQEDISMYKALEAKVNTQVKRLKYLLAYVEAYEGEGWRSANLEKLKPEKELAKTHEKMTSIKQLVVKYLREIEELHAKDKQLEPLKQGKTHVAPEEIICSICGSTNTTSDNDILICDQPACFRAYHQQCLDPPVSTREIPVGTEDWFCHGCAAMFESLKKINYALGTMYETPDEVFPELAGAMASVQEPEGERKTDGRPPNSFVKQSQLPLAEEDEDDEDFVMSESPPTSDSGEEEEEVKSDRDDDTREEEEDAQEPVKIAPKVSTPPETKKRVMKTATELLHSGLQLDGAARPYRHVNFIGERVGIKAKSDPITRMGRVAEEATPPAPDSRKIITNKREWCILFDDGAREIISHRRMKRGMLLAEKMAVGGEQGTNGVGPSAGVEKSSKSSVGSENKVAKRSLEETAPDSPNDDLSPRFGKRKRTPVDYRKLNYLLFASQVDSDDDGEMYTRKSSVSSGVKRGSDSEGSKKESGMVERPGVPADVDLDARLYRNRKPVDYRAMNDGLKSE